MFEWLFGKPKSQKVTPKPQPNGDPKKGLVNIRTRVLPNSQPDSQSDPLRQSLLGQSPLDQWPKGDEQSIPPWGDFVNARLHLQSGNVNDAIGWWQHIVATPKLESRHYVQAWNFLRSHGANPAPEQAKENLGVVIEAGMATGLDILAAYPDCSARFYNHAGVAAIWERPDASLDATIQSVLKTASAILPRMESLEGLLPKPPGINNARISILTPSGLHFAQAPIKALEADPSTRPLMLAGVALIKAFSQKNLARKQARPVKE